MTDTKKNQSKTSPKATFGGETVEPRILLSATWITGTSGNNTLNGTAGDDCIDGGAGNDTINAGNGDDVLRGGPGNDQLNGGQGIDTADYSTAPGSVNVNMFFSKVTGAAGTDTLNSIERVVGSDFADTFSDGFGNDTMVGGAGDDTFVTAIGNDTIDGGTGTDTIHYGYAMSAVTVDLTVTGPQITGGAGTDTISNVENVVGTHRGDTFRFSNPTPGAVYGVDGGNGADTIDVSTYASTSATVSASSVTIDMGSGDSFQINFTNVESILFSDAAFAPTAAIANDPPTASAGPDQVVNEGEVVTLTAIGSSDPNGNTLNYTWVQTAGPPVALSNPNAVQPTFTAPEGLSNTTVEFSLIANDGVNASGVDMVTITINADNDAPSANAGIDQTVSEGDVVMLTGDASTDPEAVGLTYNWVQTAGPAVTLSDPNAAQPTFTAPEGLTNAAVQFSLTVSDGVNTSSLDTVTITINADNDAPSANAGIDQTVSEGDVVMLTGDASTDPEAVGLTYSWVQTAGPAVTLSNANSAQPTFTAPEGVTNAAVQFSLTVSDGVNTSSVDTVTITINADNGAPTANAGSNRMVDEGELVALNGLGSTDPEGQSLTYSWEQTGGPEVKLSDLTVARPTFTAPDTVANTVVRFQLTVSDGTNTSVDTVLIGIRADNDAPLVDAGPDQFVDPSDVVRLNASARDPEGLPLTYTWQQVGGPQVALSDATIGNPTFVAPNGANGATLVFSVGVSDGNTTSVDTVSVVVASNAAPTVQVQASPTAESGQVAVVSASAADAEGNPLSYRWTQVSGTPVTFLTSDQPNASFVAPDVTRSTAVVFQVEVSDGQSTTTQTISMMVAPPPAIAAPAVSTGGTDLPAENPAPVESPIVLELPNTELPAVTTPSNTASQLSSAKTELSEPSGGTTTNTGPADPTVPVRAAPEIADEPAAETPIVIERISLDADEGDDDDSPFDLGQRSNDLVITEAGQEVDLTPRLPEPAAGATYNWVQVAGTKIELEETEGRVLRIKVPEVFLEEDLVFAVELMFDGQRVVQEVTVKVQPVSMTARSMAIDTATDASGEQEVHDTASETGRGLGKIWAALLTFVTAQPKGGKQ